MAKENKKEKGLLDKVIDLVTDRDEKEAAAKAEAERQAAEARMKAAYKQAQEHREGAARRAQVYQENARRAEQADKLTDQIQASQEMKHTVVPGETLSHISLKYYQTANRWKEIYEANKATIGDNPGMIYPGQVFIIPGLKKTDK
jgi:nucleoid-associated protein YgaU